MTYSPNYGTPKLTRANSAVLLNNSGATLPKGTPVSLGPSGLSLIDVSNQVQSTSIVGVVLNDILNGASGEVVGLGIIPNITTSFNLGDVVYVDVSGNLTNIEPDIGVNSFVENDTVIKVGVISKNPDNPTLKDLVVSIDVRGSL